MKVKKDRNYSAPLYLSDGRPVRKLFAKLARKGAKMQKRRVKSTCLNAIGSMFNSPFGAACKAHISTGYVFFRKIMPFSTKKWRYQFLSGTKIRRSEKNCRKFENLIAGIFGMLYAVWEISELKHLWHMSLRNLFSSVKTLFSVLDVNPGSKLNGYLEKILTRALRTFRIFTRRKKPM